MENKKDTMKILLILPKIGSDARWIVGLAFMSAVLKEAGYKVELLEINTEDDKNKILSVIKSFQPQIIGLSTNSHQYVYCTQIAKDIKKEFDVPLFIGGVHVTLRPEEVIREKSFDGICIGEGEYPFLELVKRIEKRQDYTDIKNFWFRKGEKIIKNDLSSLTEDLDRLPFPDYSIFKYYKEAGNKEIMPRFMFSRGCPFNCTYCCNHIFKKIYSGHGKYVRFRSVDKTLDEIELLKRKYSFNYFTVDDDIFSLNKPWLLDFCEKYSKKFDMKFECNVRIGTIDEEAMKALKGAGCKLIKVGLETGNEGLRKEVLGRNISNKEVIKLFDLAKKIGLQTFTFNMIGIPGETKQTIKETIDLNAKIKADFLQLTVFYPYPGTLLGEKCIHERLIARGQLDSLFTGESILDLPDLTSKDIKRAAKNFKFNVYKQYSLKRALQHVLKEKKAILTKFIVSKPILYETARRIYRLLKV